MKIIKIVIYIIAILYFINAIQNVLAVYYFKTAKSWEISGSLNNLMLIGLVVFIFILKNAYKLIKKI